jgi:DNA-binding response OmpR family regulator
MNAQFRKPDDMHSGKTVLIVDDETNVRLMLRTALASAGYSVVEAEDGHAALKRLRENACSIVLLDLKMPRMDGMELLRQLRSEGSTVPVVMLTAHGSIHDAVEAMKLGAIDFVTKPITPDALRKVVAEVIARQSVEATPVQSTGAVPEDRSKQIKFDLARAKRALNFGQFSAAEPLLREIVALDPASQEAHELLDRLETLKAQEERGSFRILRDWFPSGKVRGKP